MKGIIICTRKDAYTVYNPIAKSVISAQASGLFRHQGLKPKVGDYIMYQLMNDKEAYITELLPRFNDLERPAICNIDQAFVVFSIKEPEFNTNLLDRFLTILNFSNIKTVIVCSKWDLIEDRETINKYVTYYEKLGYEVIKTSSKPAEEPAITKIKTMLKDKVSVVAGQSGVGKSTLLNIISPSLNLVTQEISQALGRGKHTTRHVELIPIEEGWIADTPGFGIMDFTGMTESDIAQSFPEFFKLSENCKYKGCLHQNEPHCKVKEALLDGTILRSRYENYLNFLDECRKLRKW